MLISDRLTQKEEAQSFLWKNYYIYEKSKSLRSHDGKKCYNILSVEKINKILNSNIENALVNEIKRHDLHRKVTYHKEYKNLSMDD